MATLKAWQSRWRRHLSLPPNDLLRDAIYRRLWSSILISSFGGQVTMLALPLTAAVLLQATPDADGPADARWRSLPFVLFSLPSGVWLDRVRKLPVYVVGESTLALIVASVPLAWWLGWLSMTWLYVVGFVIGTVLHHRRLGRADRADAGGARASGWSRRTPRTRWPARAPRSPGPGLAGVLIKLVGAPLALLVDAAMLVLLGAHPARHPRAGAARAARRTRTSGATCRPALRFVRRHACC